MNFCCSATYIMVNTEKEKNHVKTNDKIIREPGRDVP